MSQRKYEYWHFYAFVMTFGVSYLIELGVRQYYIGDNPSIIYILGSLPNFLPSIGFACLIYFFLLKMIKYIGKYPLSDRPKHLALGLNVGILIFLEFLQIWSPADTFDWNDILWTLVGGMIFYVGVSVIEMQRQGRVSYLWR